MAARILTEKLFKLRYAVGGKVKPALIIEAVDMEEADDAVLLYAADQEDYSGEEIRVLSATELDLDSL